MELFRAWILFAFLVAEAVAGGEGNVTTKTYGHRPGLQATFASEPGGRGTIGIIISCTATFFFCIWTAVHPNIVPGATTMQRLCYKNILMLIAIFVPEGVLICAIGEWNEAKGLCKAWKDEPRIPKLDKGKMNMQVAFFVVMGGFFIDEQEADVGVEPPPHNKPSWNCRVFCCISCRGNGRDEEKQSPKSRPNRAILTSTGFKKYIKEGYIHGKTFDKASVNDKSKANAFAKVVATTQALWLVANCAARWNSELRLTLVEVHVVIHVVRTALIYRLWWNKPLDVNEPIRIKLRKQEDETDHTSNEEVANGKSGIFVHGEPVTSSPGQLVSEIPEISSVPDKSSLPNHKVFRPLKNSLEQEKKISKTYNPNEPPFITRQSPPNFSAFFSKATYDILIQIDIGERAGRQELGESPTENKSDSPDPGPPTGQESSPPSTGKANDSLDTKPSVHESNRSGQVRTGLLVETLLICLTGALHAAAWNIGFPTTVEEWLWRASSLMMCFCSSIIFLIANFTEYEQDLIAAFWSFQLGNENNESIITRMWQKIDEICKKHAGVGPQRFSKWKYAWHHVGIWSSFFFVSLYFFSVVYITLESYLSLRSPEPGTFLTPSWADYWPHL